ncbi:MAG TPA: c-type cytochrome [Sphingomicrobium sp.]|nr:c-type cytochrome [Sphingomicrobium sp.]
MDRWEWTKVGTAVTLAVGVIVAGNFLAGQLIDARYPESQGYPIEGVAPVDLGAVQRSWPAGLSDPGDAAMLRGYMAHIDKAVVPVPAGGVAATAAAAPVDLGTLLASADLERGKGTAKLCVSCHTLDRGGANGIGPNLWGIVGRDIGGSGGYAYSPAVAGHPGTWTYEELDSWLASPARAIPANKMAFNGLRNPKDRANLLAYLATLGPARVPFPAPKPVEAEPEAANTAS